MPAKPIPDEFLSSFPSEIQLLANELRPGERDCPQCKRGGLHRLEGDGTQVRYLTVREPGDIEPERFRAFIAEAAQIALLRKRAK